MGSARIGLSGSWVRIAQGVACSVVLAASLPTAASAGWDDDLALCQNDEGEAQPRMESCSRLIADASIQPEIKAEAYLNRGILYDERGEPLKAIVDLTEGIKLNPEYPALYFFRGVAYDNASKTRLSIADFSEALRLDPTETDALVYRGMAYAGLGDRDKALADFDAALALDPNEATALSGRGEIYEAKGEREKALADFRKALEIEPDNEDAAEGLKRLEPK